MNLENQATTVSDIPSRPLLTLVHHPKASCLTKYGKRHKLVAHDEADVHQLRNVISETKEIVHLYLEAFKGWVEQTKEVDKILSYNIDNIVYNVDNIVSDNDEESSREKTATVNTMEEEYLYEFGRLDDL
ncbi:unnamed protein product [Lactuca saligna]|uniref:Uncharacterized protein n=1 Tax=Lactuca saligna TaxID=75948 RepID=A0AA36EMG8_LACSI|nr:unnamed protein product [Lactuca saligna]